MVIVALAIVMLCWLIKRSSYVVCASAGYLIHSISLDLLALGFLNGQMDFGNVEAYSFEYFYSFIITSCTLIIFTFFLRYKNDLYPHPTYSKRVVRLGYIFLSISFIALLLNLNRTGGVALMFIEPRLYELTFGESVFLNYLYFLHLPAAILFVVAYISSRNNTYLLLIIVSVILSLFHGIKFTIIHAFIYPMLVFWIYSGYKFNKYIVVSGLSLVAIIVTYFNEVRGNIDDLLGYLTSSSMNALFLLSKVDLVINSPVGVIFPDIGFFFQRLLERVFAVPIESTSYDPFVLNTKYNLVPSWYSASLVGLPSYLVVVGLLCVVISFIRKHYYPNIGRAAIEAHIYFTLLLSFQGWALFSLKMTFIIFILLLCFPLKRDVVKSLPVSR
jgi:hypothetical protein